MSKGGRKARPTLRTEACSSDKGGTAHRAAPHFGRGGLSDAAPAGFAGTLVCGKVGVDVVDGIVDLRDQVGPSCGHG